MAVTRKHATLITALFIFLAANALKGWVLAGKPSALLFWSIDITYFIVLPTVLSVWLWRAQVFPVPPSRPPVSGWAWWVVVVMTVLVLGGGYVALVKVAGPLLEPKLKPYWPGWIDYGRVGLDIPRWVTGGYFALTAAIVEETVYRGWMSRLWSLDSALGKFGYVVVSSIMFALVHWASGGVSVVLALAFGLAAATAYLALRRLWPLMLGHFLAGAGHVL